MIQIFTEEKLEYTHFPLKKLNSLIEARLLGSIIKKKPNNSPSKTIA
jgi:hypothetical protein